MFVYLQFIYILVFVILFVASDSPLSYSSQNSMFSKRKDETKKLSFWRIFLKVTHKIYSNDIFMFSLTQLWGNFSI